jgi:hypothetical protein
VCHASDWVSGIETSEEGHVRSQDITEATSMDDAMVYSNVAYGRFHVPTEYLAGYHQL